MRSKGRPLIPEVEGERLLYVLEERNAKVGLEDGEYIGLARVDVLSLLLRSGLEDRSARRWFMILVKRSRISLL